MADKAVVVKKTTIQKPRRARQRSSSRGRSRSRSRSRSRVRKVKIIETAPKSILKTRPKQTRILRKIKKLERKTNGPIVNDRMRTTITVCKLTGNGSNTLARQAKVFLNPCLLKNQDSGATSSPLSVRASQYALWKIQSIRLTFQPLCGSANVIGSVIFADLDQEASTATAQSPDTIKARPHVEVPLGMKHTWVIKQRQLEGPREGWWNMDPGESPTTANGPALNFWVYLETFNALQAQSASPTPYTGPLALVEVTVEYVFSNYSPKPNLATMVNQVVTPSSTTSVKLKNNTDGSLIMEVTDSTLRRILDQPEECNARAQTSGKGDTFWSVSTTVVDIVAQHIGPWGWLLKGGWWVVRKIFGAANGTSNYAVYASVEDAQNDNRIYQTVNGEISIASAPVHVTQLTQPNVNQGGSLSVSNQPGPVVIQDYLPLSHAQSQMVPPLYNQDMQPYTLNWTSNMYALLGIPIENIIDGGGIDVMGTSGLTSQSQRWRVLDYTNTGVFFSPAREPRFGVINTARNMWSSLLQFTGDKSPWQPENVMIHKPSGLRLPAQFFFMAVSEQSISQKPPATGSTQYGWCIIDRGTPSVKVYWPTDNNLTSNKMWVWLQKSTSTSHAWDEGLHLVLQPNCDSEMEDDEISEISSLFEDPEINQVETDFKMKLSLQTARHAEEEAKYWKEQCRAMMLEKAMQAGTGTPLVRFEKCGQGLEQHQNSSSSRGHAE
nr:capsid protein [Chicken astrovirus]